MREATARPPTPLEQSPPGSPMPSAVGGPAANGALPDAAVRPLPETWRSIDLAGEEPPESPAPARHVPVLGLALVGLGLSASAVGLLALSPTPDVVVSATGNGGAIAASSSGPLASSASWLVDVGGAVVRPGMYALPPGSRVSDAIRAAGGYGPRVDAATASATLNLAEILHDGSKIVVPERGATTAGGGPAGASGGGGSGAAAGLTDLNRATASELDTLPGVGPVTAAKIIGAREEKPFASVDELLSRKVVSASVLAKIRSLVTVGR